MDKPLLNEDDVDLVAGTHEVIQLQLTEDSGGSDNVVHVAGEVRILFSNRPAPRNMRDSKNVIVPNPLP